MGLFTRLFKVGSSIAGSKGTRKAAATGLQSFTNKGVLKTTGAILGQGTTKATRGGVKVAAGAAGRFAKGTSDLARVGGKVVAGTAIVGLPVTGGLIAYNKIKDSIALTDTDRRMNTLLDQAQRFEEIMLSQGKAPDAYPATGNPFVDFDPTATGNSGVGGQSFNPFLDQIANPDAPQRKGSAAMGGIGIAAGIAAILGGGYLIMQKRRKGKK